MRSLIAAIAMSIAIVSTSVASAGATTFYVGNQTSSSYSGFSLSATGQPTALLGSPFATATGEPRGMIFSADGTRMYAGHRTANVISQHSVGADGSVGSLGLDLPYPSTPYSPALRPDGSSLYYSSATFNQSVVQYKIAADGTLTAGASAPVGSNGAGSAVSRDGRFLYVCSSLQGLHGFNLASDGTPTAISGFGPSGFPCSAVAATPDGRFLVVVDSTGVRSATINPDGTLTQVGSATATGPSPNYVAVAPDGSAAYVLNAGSGALGANIATFSIAADGSATHVGTDLTFTAPTTYANGIAVSPDGRFVVAGVSAATNNVHVFATNPGAGVTAVAGSPFSSGANMGGGSPAHEVAFRPDQGPSIASATVSGTDRKRTLTANGAADPDGAVTSYRWDFGDGTTATTATASTTHTYAKSGNYNAQVSAIDNENCGASDIFDGRLFLCNAAPNTSIAVDALAPSLTKLKFSKKSIKRKKSVKLSYKLSEAGTIKLQFQTKKGKKYKTRGTVTFASKSGTRKRTISTKVKKKYLPKGKYRVLVTVTDANKSTSTAKKLSLTIR